MAAARWLVDAGDTGQALRLLTWVEGPYLLHPSVSCWPASSISSEGESRSGLDGAEPAVKHYQDFLRRYDRAVARHHSLVAEAKAALERLGDQGGR